ncbi:MAG: hypothetical protein IJP71_03275 [Lachnospiraceae bacterium]|nr:hypothetical protein [Lachnospiraceae bacterium]
MFLDIIVETEEIIEPIINEGKPAVMPIVVVAVVVVAIVIAVLCKLVIKRELSNAKRV